MKKHALIACKQVPSIQRVDLQATAYTKDPTYNPTHFFFFFFASNTNKILLKRNQRDVTHVQKKASSTIVFIVDEVSFVIN